MVAADPGQQRQVAAVLAPMRRAPHRQQKAAAEAEEQLVVAEGWLAQLTAAAQGRVEDRGVSACKGRSCVWGMPEAVAWVGECGC